jgi:hypothetical protein
MTIQTHESYIQEVRAIALRYAEHVRDNPQLQLAGIPALSDEAIMNLYRITLIAAAGDPPVVIEYPWPERFGAEYHAELVLAQSDVFTSATIEDMGRAPLTRWERAISGLDRRACDKLVRGLS